MSASERRDTFGLSGFFALRTPLLAFDELRAWSDGLQAPQALDHPDQVDAALAADRAVLAERLLAVWRRLEVREAVFLASPELDAALERLTGGAAGEKALARAGRLLRADGRAIDALWLVCRVQRRRPGHVNHARAAGAVDVWPPHAAGHGLPRRAGECLGNRPSGASDATLSAQFESLPRGWPPSLRGVRPLPDALAVFARLAAASAEAADRGDFRLWPQGASGPSGALLLGRFCHADPDLHRRVVDHLRAEEAHQPDVAFAEIVHLPEGRLGNILSRPLLRDYEIPFSRSVRGYLRAPDPGYGPAHLRAPRANRPSVGASRPRSGPTVDDGPQLRPARPRAVPIPVCSPAAGHAGVAWLELGPAGPGAVPSASASQDVRSHTAAVFVLTSPNAARVVGFYTLSAFAILLTELPGELSRRLPRYPQVPAVLLGRLAVDQHYASQGWGKVLLLDALKRSLEQASQIAAMAVVVDAIDRVAVTFYERYGFQRLGHSENRLFLPMRTIAHLF